MKLAGPPRCLFVYGTLRRGEYNHALLRAAPFLGGCRTAGRYTLFHLGRYPAAMAGGRTAVVGEVYALNKALLARLDRLEDYPREYSRECIATPYGPAWIYLYRRPPAPDTPVIVSGNWLLARRPHPCPTARATVVAANPGAILLRTPSGESVLGVSLYVDRSCRMTMNHQAADYFAKPKMTVRLNL